MPEERLLLTAHQRHPTSVNPYDIVAIKTRNMVEKQRGMLGRRAGSSAKHAGMHVQNGMTHQMKLSPNVLPSTTFC